jgi:hypothetical protein
MAFFCAEEPPPLMLPVAQSIADAPPADAEPLAGELGSSLLSSEPHAATLRLSSAATAMPAAAD